MNNIETFMFAVKERQKTISKNDYEIKQKPVENVIMETHNKQ